MFHFEQAGTMCRIGTGLKAGYQLF